MLQQVLNRPTVRRGDSGPVVEHLQQTLKKLGYDPGPIDGIFGYLTERAVKNFQAAQGLRIDGIVGPKTWAALGERQEAKTYKGWSRKYWWLAILLLGALVFTERR